MAYTYDDFVAAANKAGLLEQFSEYDLETAKKNPEFGLGILGLKQDAANATTQEQRLLANEAANQLRRSYGGYTGGSDGSGYTLAGNAQKPADGSFAYGNNKAYQQLLSGVVGQGSFSYDPKTDPSYSAYRKAYLREGERASANALAQASAATGGMPSSYAVSAAQQAANYYAGQAADAIPTLEQNAYQRYLDAQNLKLNALQALERDRAFDYGKYLDDVSMGLTGGGTGGAGAVTGGAGGGTVGGTGIEYDNGTLTPEQVMQMQAAMKIESDGKYGPKTQAAFGGLSADDAWALFTGETLEPGEVVLPPEVLTQLQTYYGNGIVTNAKDWQYLLQTYGEDALAAAGYSPSFSLSGEYSNVAARFPDGKIHDKAMYDSLVKRYGEDALLADGFVYEPDYVKYRVTNQHNDEIITLSGYSNITWEDLAQLVLEDKVVPEYNDTYQTITYRKVRTKEAG